MNYKPFTVPVGNCPINCAPDMETCRAMRMISAGVGAGGRNDKEGFFMLINPNTIAECLKQGSDTLLNIIQHIKDNHGENEVINGLGCVQASIYTLQVLFAGIDGKPDVEELTGKRIKPPQELIPAAVADVEDDNPENEDKDIQKAREESQGFFR